MNVKAIIEIPKNSTHKYEINKETGRLYLDRTLNQKIPANYGYIENTSAPDGDNLDIFVISEHPIDSLTEVEVTIVAAFRCTDNGISDDKLIAVLKESNNHQMDHDIWRYLNTYKKDFKVLEFMSESEAVDIYLGCKQ